ncbi:MAG: 30S ribosomal protein S18 [Elusimicrobiota bacterium]
MKSRRKRCRFCRDGTDIDYKDTELLSSFMQSRAKIVPRSLSGNCAKHQRLLTREIKRARNLALLPFVT